jgi:iron complex outermembrane recepter protein
VPNAKYPPKTSSDPSLTWAFSASTKLTVGGANIFNVTPTRQNANGTDNGFHYDSVQFGLPGRLPNPAIPVRGALFQPECIYSKL